MCWKLKNMPRLQHPNYSIGKLGQNTEKSPEDLRRLAVTQTPVNIGVKKMARDIFLTLELFLYLF